MKNIIAALFLLLLATAFSSPGDRKKKKELFNGKDLSGWDTYLGPAYDSVLNKFSGNAEGLNKDPHKVFSVARTDGKAAIRISGERFGGISTTEMFENYHLRLEFKWGKQKWLPKKKDARDSGLLYHAVGRHGADGNFWMRSQEFQIQEKDCGDYWGVAGGTADIPAIRKNDTQFVYDSEGALLTFSATSDIGRRCIKNPDAEKPSGQWNVIDLYCIADTSVHVVNNVVNMILYNLRQEDEGKFSPLKKGKIQIQSEGAEVFYRNITVEYIDRIPAEILKGG
jgi:hypothetical protein